MATVISLAVLIFILSGTSCILWTGDLRDDQHVYACAGSDVSLPWTFTLEHGDSITSIQWFFNDHSQEMIAIFSHGSFIPLPAFSQLVEHTTNGGLILRHVTMTNSGNYTVEVNGVDASGSFFTLRHTVHVQVSDGLMTSNGQHHITQSSRVVYDDVTGKWSLQLTCGNFIYQDQPPFPLEWVTPSGRRFNSTGYHDNHFYFLVPNPAESGRYTCRVPDNWTSQACLSAGHPREAYLTLDSVDVRLMLMEAELRSLRQNVVQLQQENQRLTQNITHVQDENQQLKTDNQHLTQQVSALGAELHEMAKHRSAFLVQFSNHTLDGTSPSTPLNYDRIIFSDGNNYDPASGVFTAPFPGVYVFCVKVFTSEHVIQRPAVDIIHNGHTVDRLAYDYLSSRTGHGGDSRSMSLVLRLAERDTVWVRVVVGGTGRVDLFEGQFHTSFSGALLYSD